MEKLGSGGMAEVFKAKDTILNRTVALKVLRPQFAQEKNFVERLRREAQAAANLNHPNIVNVFDWGSRDSTYYIVMEYLAGKTLKQIIESRGPLPAKRVIEIASQVCAALQFAHRREVIHRDIKPHNIIITHEGDVKVTDFGIAQAGTSPSLTQTGSIIGTAQYISPEQARGYSVQRTSDIYSLGVVMYEMLTGEVPFPGDNPVAVAFRQVHEELKPPRAINPAIPRSLETVVLKAMAKNVSQRYQSAEKMQADLALCAAGQPVAEQIPAVPPTEEIEVLPPRRSRYKKKRPLTPWLVLSGLLIFSIILISYLWASNLTPAPVTVPSIEGKTVKEASPILEEKGLKLTVAERAFSNAVEKGLIMNQNPEAGSKIGRGSTVEVTVSKGVEMVKVPQVVGQTSEEAGFTLAEVGIQIGKMEKTFSEEVPEGLVISQSPRGGKKIAKGGAVNILVSKGEERILVPDLIGRTVKEAAPLLSEVGLRMKQREEFSETVPAGEIIRQSPLPDLEVKKGTTVTVVVSKGVEEVTVPDLRNLTEAEAKAKLEETSLLANIQYQSSDQKGKVLSQYPAPETKVKKKSVVSVYVGN